MKNSTIILSVLLCFLNSFQGIQAQSQTDPEALKSHDKIEAKNIAIIKRVYEELNTNKNIYILEELYSSDYKFYFPSNIKNHYSLEQSKDYYSRVFKAFPDLKFEIKNIFADGDHVIVRSVFTGTHDREYAGVKSFGNKVEVGEIIIYKLQNGKIVEERYEMDKLNFKDQLKNEIPDGWWKGGDSKESYSVGIDEENTHKGYKSAFIVSIDEEINGFSTLSQYIKANSLRGKRIKMTGYVKTEDVENWAGFWIRADGERKFDKAKNREWPELLAFDNMEDRPIIGTTDWTKYEIEIEVPEASLHLAFGTILSGKGKVWVDNFSFEEVTDDESQPTKYISEGPVNTSFEE